MDDSVNNMTRALSETDLRDVSLPKKKPLTQMFGGLSVEDKEENLVEKGFRAYSRMASFCGGLFPFSELDEECEVGPKDDGSNVGVLVDGEIGGAGGGTIGCGGGGGGSNNGDYGRSGFWDSNHRNDSVGMYYQTMIEANPGNPLLLSNCAKFMKEERLNRALMVCQDKYEAAKMQKKPGAMNDMVSCVDQSIQDGIKILPHKLPMEIGRENLPFTATIL